MEIYDRKLSEVRSYVPFLENLIFRSERLSDPSKAQHLAKMKNLHRLLTGSSSSSSNHHLDMNTLLKSEEILRQMKRKFINEHQGSGGNPQDHHKNHSSSNFKYSSGIQPRYNHHHRHPQHHNIDHRKRGFFQPSRGCYSGQEPRIFKQHPSPFEPRFQNERRLHHYRPDNRRRQFEEISEKIPYDSPRSPENYETPKSPDNVEDTPASPPNVPSIPLENTRFPDNPKVIPLERKPERSKTRWGPTVPAHPIQHRPPIRHPPRPLMEARPFMRPERRPFPGVRNEIPRPMNFNSPLRPLLPRPKTYGEYRKLQAEFKKIETPDSPPHPISEPESTTVESPESPIQSPIKVLVDEDSEDLTDSDSENLKIDLGDEQPSSPIKKLAPIAEPKVETKEEESDEEDIVPLRRTRSRSKKEKRIKKDFDTDSEEEREITSPVKVKTEIKKPLEEPALPPKEPTPPPRPRKSPDKDVFLGTKIEEVTEFKTKSGTFDNYFIQDLKSRKNNLETIRSKLFESEKEKSKSTGPKIKITSVKPKKLPKSSSSDSLLITTLQPQNYKDRFTKLIQNLSASVQINEISEENEETMDLLTAITDMKFVSPPDLHVQSRPKSKSLKFLFKCWKCSFSTNYPNKFEIHLSEENPSQFICLYCSSSSWTDSKSLIDHVISTHGRCPYQCPYCFYRSISQLNLFLHQKSLHPNYKPGYFLVKSLTLPSESDSSSLELQLYYCSLCSSYSSKNPKDLALHYENKHKECSISYHFDCTECSRPFPNIVDLLIHRSEYHSHSNPDCDVLQIKLIQDPVRMSELPPPVPAGPPPKKKKEESSEPIFGCKSCKIFFKTSDELLSHLGESCSLACIHCEILFQSPQSLIEHLKTHEHKKYSCSLCQLKFALPCSAKSHLKSVHKVPLSKVLPEKINGGLVIVPKNAQAFRTKNVFSPYSIDSIPKTSVVRTAARCSECDFVSRIRLNMVKHLKIHLKEGISSPITPINPPPNLDSKNFKSMFNSVSDEGDGPLNKEQLTALPALVPENLIYKCCSEDCNYIGIDEVMLAYHVKTLHSKFKSIFPCPHCADKIPYEDLGLHLKCHGELLFRCRHCSYYHWKKRTAEKHVMEVHRKIRPPMVHDVRTEFKLLSMAVKETSKSPIVFNQPLKPYKCGLCDKSEQNSESLINHVEESHGLKSRYFCGVCSFKTDEKSEILNHVTQLHEGIKAFCMRTTYIEQSSGTDNEPQRAPLWTKKIIEEKHIRGIFFDVGDGVTKLPNKVSEKTVPETQTKTPKSVPTLILECKECGLKKRSSRTLKVHIKSNHLNGAAYICRLCHYHTSVSEDIIAHYSNIHGSPNISIETLKKENFQVTSKYWKLCWDIPLPPKKNGDKHQSIIDEEISSNGPPPAKKAKEDITPKKIKEETTPKRSKELLAANTSLFEHLPTFKCGYCPKRSQSLIKIERHLSSVHSNQASSHKLLTRDQVVDLITSSSCNAGDYYCFLCDTPGTIFDLQKHFQSNHPDEALKVKKAPKAITGYLECQICGYLNPGFDKSGLRVHFHEEHPLEENVVTNKYALKVKTSEVSSSSNESKKLDHSKYNGQDMNCPKIDCEFQAKSMNAMYGHMKKHTITFKCGHCGLLSENTSLFDQHSALAHGDKIPDLVKDPGADAEYEALKALFECSLIASNQNSPAST